jgi:hypothetical protein
MQALAAARKLQKRGGSLVIAITNILCIMLIVIGSIVAAGGHSGSGAAVIMTGIGIGIGFATGLLYKRITCNESKLLNRAVDVAGKFVPL